MSEEIIEHIHEIVIDPVQTHRALARFKLLNTQRFRQVQESLGHSQRIFLDTLALLFHINHPMLPGFQSDETPCGISHYSPNELAIEQAKILAKTFQPKQPPNNRLIHAIYIMGSTGTIAYSKDSDFDIWICHDPELDEQARFSLQRKAKAIESWGESLGLEIHFFILDEESFKNEQHAELSKHSSGNSQHVLLLDEFYRTSILITGRHPVWWLVPPAFDSNYGNYKQELLSQHIIKPDEVIDLGGLETLPVEEFYGASLWQLTKAIDSPYKSILKLNLLESYTAGPPYNKLLAQRFKEYIYDETHRLESLDPYVMTYRAIEDYLFASRQTRRLNLIRRCFYFKVDEPLYHSQNKGSWRRTQLEYIVENWGWSKDKTLRLDQRRLWKTRQVIDEHQRLMRELESSYHRITYNASHGHNSEVCYQRDIGLLRKKLATVFSPQEKTIELFNPGISDNLQEQELTFVLCSDNPSAKWALYSGKYTPDETADDHLLKEMDNLIELLAWCHFNKIIFLNIHAIHLYPAHSNHHWEMLSLMSSIQDYFPHGSYTETDITALSKPAVLERTCIFLNTSIDPKQQFLANGVQLLTNQTDPLNYGQHHSNLIQRCEMLGLSSWQQIVFKDFNTPNALFDCICGYLSWFTEQTGTPEIPVFCNFSSVSSNAITRRITELFKNIINCFYGQDSAYNSRYLLQTGGHYYLFEIENKSAKYKQFQLRSELLQALSESLTAFTITQCDKTSLANTTLAQVLTNNQPNIIQLFYVIQDCEASVFILGENGALFYERVVFRDQHTLLNPYLTFLKSIHKNHQPVITVNQISAQKLDLRQADLPEYIKPIANLSVKLNCSLNELREEHIEIKFGDIIFKAGTQDIFQKAARCVVDSRQSKGNYPVHITDIEYSMGTDNGSIVVDTTQLLKLKRHMETQLNTAISSTVLPVT